jgi:hypothetical protein
VFNAIRVLVTVTDKAIPSEEFHKVIEEVSAKAQAEQEIDAALRASIEE